MSSYLDSAEDVDFITKTAIERDPKKRRVKPLETQASILDFDLEESSDDSDFRIEDHPGGSDDSVDSNGEGDDSSDDDDDEEDDSQDSDDLEELKKLNSLGLPGNGISVADVLKKATDESDNLKFNENDVQLLICCGCLGDQSDGANEIIECDSCGVTVHEACYGVSDSASMASTDSLSPTAPWFCEACKAGVMNPDCELCPNSGGIFKETDVGKWVHLVCALYVPGVAFGEVDRLSSVTLFEMPYNKWGAKACGLCQDDRYARTGVCIGCDAGMCRTYFHVTCAQREGFLSEAHSEEVDQADPFYAHCKLHSDKTLVKKRRKNYLSLQLRTHYRRLQMANEDVKNSTEQLRIRRKLEKQRVHYLSLKSLKQPPWVPTQKMSRLVTTSASVCRKLLRKADLMGIDIPALESQEAQAAALIDIRKKWHISPAFTVEFIAYYLDRNDRLKNMKSSLESLLEHNKQLLDDQQSLRVKYDQLMKESSDENRKNAELKQTINKYHSAILSASPTKNLPDVSQIGKPSVARAPQSIMVPTAAALKMGVGFPLSNIPSGRNDGGRVLSSQARQAQESVLLKECGICRQRVDQHLLAKCDTCHLFYHLNCLNPPLTRFPKKSKLYGWQCSECDKSSDSELEQVKAPRRSRSCYSKEFRSDQETLTPKVKIKPIGPKSPEIMANVSVVVTDIMAANQLHSKYSKLSVVACDGQEGAVKGGDPIEQGEVVAMKNGLEGGEAVVMSSRKKRRREKHRNRYSPDMDGGSKEHKRKRKKKSLDIEESPTPHPRITIKIRPIPPRDGEPTSSSNPQCFYVPNENNDNMPPPPVKQPVTKQSPTAVPAKSPVRVSALATNDLTELCDVCKEIGNKANLVNCDECQKGYHFTCLEPPLKKSPKRRGYSWQCEDCDPTASESN